MHEGAGGGRELFVTATRTALLSVLLCFRREKGRSDSNSYCTAVRPAVFSPRKGAF